MGRETLESHAHTVVITRTLKRGRASSVSMAMRDKLTGTAVTMETSREMAEVAWS